MRNGSVQDELLVHLRTSINFQAQILILHVRRTNWLIPPFMFWQVIMPSVLSNNGAGSDIFMRNLLVKTADITLNNEKNNEKKITLKIMLTNTGWEDIPTCSILLE